MVSHCRGLKKKDSGKLSEKQEQIVLNHLSISGLFLLRWTVIRGLKGETVYGGKCGRFNDIHLLLKAVSQVDVYVAREQLSKVEDSKWVCGRKTRETMTEIKSTCFQSRVLRLTYLNPLLWKVPVRARCPCFFLFSRPCFTLCLIPADPP